MSQARGRTGKVAIVIVSYKCADDILGCLDYVAALNYSNFEVHVCENGGRDAYGSLVKTVGAQLDPAGRTFPARAPDIVETHAGGLRPGGQMVFLHHVRANLGYAGGVNAGADWIKDDPEWSAIWVLNPDTEPHPDALGALVARMAAGKYGVVGSRLIEKESGRIQLYGGRWRRWLGRGFDIGRNSAPDAMPDVAAVEKAMTYVAGASMLVSRDYIDEVGLMDDRYFLYNEEVDWCFRRGRFALGYAHDSVIHHVLGGVMGSSANRKRRSKLAVYLEERNKILFTQRHYPRLYPLVVVSTFLLTAQYLTSGAYKNFWTALSGWFAGLQGETGPPAWHSPDPRRRPEMARAAE